MVGDEGKSERGCGIGIDGERGREREKGLRGVEEGDGQGVSEGEGRTESD